MHLSVLLEQSFSVLEVIEDEKLQENSLVVGNFLKTNLKEFLARL